MCFDLLSNIRYYFPHNLIASFIFCFLLLISLCFFLRKNISFHLERNLDMVVPVFNLNFLFPPFFLEFIFLLVLIFIFTQ